MLAVTLPLSSALPLSALLLCCSLSLRSSALQRDLNLPKKAAAARLCVERARVCVFVRVGVQFEIVYNSYKRLCRFDLSARPLSLTPASSFSAPSRLIPLNIT